MSLISRSPFFCRIYLHYVLPLFWLLVAGRVVLGLARGESNILPSPSNPFPWLIWGGFVILLCVLPVIYIFLVHGFKLVDEVRDEGGVLVVLQSGQEVKIPLADISKVINRQMPVTAGYCTILILRAPCRFGRKIKFLPIGKSLLFSMPFRSDWKILNPDLLRRIEEARKNNSGQSPL